MRKYLMCILPFNYSTLGFPVPCPEVGDEVVATAEGDCEYDKDGENDCWQLEGYPPYIGYAKKCFATLPGLTADEMQELEKEAIIK